MTSAGPPAACRRLVQSVAFAAAMVTVQTSTTTGASACANGTALGEPQAV